jgi:hypothetical protein
MKTDNRIGFLILLIFCMSGGVASAQEVSSASADQGVKFAYGGDVYFALQNWSKVGMSNDSKMGYGFGGSYGLGVQVDDMKILIGPHLGYSSWSADYSSKSNSVTCSRRLNIDPPCRLNIDPGPVAVF